MIQGRGLGAREKEGMEDEGGLERALPLLARRGGTGSGYRPVQGSVEGQSRSSRLYLRVLETPEELLGCGGFCVQTCHVHTILSLWLLQTA